MAEPPLPPEETPIATGIANVLKNIFKARKVISPVTTVIEQAIASKEVADATLEGNPKVQEKLKKLQEMWDSDEHIQEFKSASGSKYKFYPDGTTIRDKSGKLSKDKSTGLQNRSGKTIFLDRNNTINVGSLFQNPDIDISIIPKPNEEKIGQVIVNESTGGFKKGQVLHEFPFSTRPIKNFTPVEIYDSRSKIGQAGRGIHFGNKITEVTNKRGGGSVIERNPYDYQPRGI